MKIELNQAELEAITSSLYPISRTDQVCHHLRRRLLHELMKVMFEVRISDCRFQQGGICRHPTRSGDRCDEEMASGCYFYTAKGAK